MCGLLMLPVMLLNFVINLIRWMFWRFGWWALLIIILFVVVVAVILAGILSPKPEAATNTFIPSVSQAPYLIETSSRYYYAAAYEKDGDTTILTGYWVFEGEKWIYYDRLVLTPAFGEVTIGRRR